MNKKLLITIGIILGLAIIAGGFWYVQRYVQDDSQEVANSEQEKVEISENENNQGTEKPEELDFEKIDTSNWKTYRNEEYGFEVKYPKGWYARVDKSGENKRGRINVTFSNYQNSFSKNNTPNNLYLCFIDIYKKNVNEYYEIRNKYSKLAKSQYSDTIYVSKKQKIDIYGIYKNNEKVDDSWDLTKPTIEGFLNGKLYNYHFFHITEYSKQKDSAMILFGILNTFKLID